MSHSFKLECRGTRHFYSLVKILNQQVGLGRWTTEGRPVRKLRRLDISNWFVEKHGNFYNTMPVVFKVPADHTDIQSVLNLWGDADGPR